MATVFPNSENNVEGYYASPIIITSDSNYSLKVEECEVSGIYIHTSYEFEFEKEKEIINAEIKFWGNSASGSLYESYPIPENLLVSVDGEKIDYHIYYDDTEIKKSQKGEFDVRIPGTVKFSFVSNKNCKIEMRYLNNPVRWKHSEILYTYYSEKVESNTKFKLVLVNNNDGKITILDEDKTMKKIDSNRSEQCFTQSDFVNFDKETYPSYTIKIKIVDFGFDEMSYFYFQDLGDKIIDKRFLLSMTKEQLRLFRNMFYAKHGYIFKDEYLRDYFNSIEGFEYKMNSKFSEVDFNEIEKKNIENIKQIEASLVK